ncbi:antibiotic biosynthesis monooxygenase family protein [Bacillus massiliglaciei]|uniref:antibiotic biosynthesis monooxygenase family protein n=1 Tax=Bacillus massiliglaciei TaxID=1816693 RepID=UPI000DA5F61D|nr:antibiotic biosynthesis monooxygenase family protein [Bacillus massiliglaciei]
MNIYITTGSYNFLKPKKEKHPKEKILMMQNSQKTLLLHETEGKTLFSSPRKFEVIESVGDWPENGITAMYHTPVEIDDQSMFELKMKKNIVPVSREAGLIALRFLRPVKSDTYVLLTVWENERSYRDWKSSPSYSEVKFYADSTKGTSTKPLFSGSAYETEYSLITE